MDRTTGLICDQTVALERLPGPQGISRSAAPHAITSIPKTGKRLVFLTNNFALPALTIADLYQCRWQVELFFKWIKQHLRIKTFLRHHRERREDANLDRHLGLRARRHRQEAAEPAAVLYEMLQILSLTLFEQMPLDELLSQLDIDQNSPESPNQMNLFD